MPVIKTTAAFLRRKKREFTARRGRMGRSLFFTNAFIVALAMGIYALLLRSLVLGMAEMHMPRLLYNNVYMVGVGVLVLGAAFFTRPLRLKRLRDIGIPARADWPFFILLVVIGLGPIFHALRIPYLESVEVVDMPDRVRDLFGIIGIIWLMLLLLAPSKHSKDPFANGGFFKKE